MPLGVTIVGGLLLSQLLTLYTTPVVYLAMERSEGASRRPRHTLHPAEAIAGATPSPAAAAAERGAE